MKNKIPDELIMGCIGMCLGLVFMWLLFQVTKAEWIIIIPSAVAMLSVYSVIWMNTKEPLKLGTFVQVYDADSHSNTSGIVIAMRSRGRRRPRLYLVATRTNIAWHTIFVGSVIEPTNPSNFCVPNPCIVKESDLPEWAITKSPTQPNSWEFVGWNKFIDLASHA